MKQNLEDILRGMRVHSASGPDDQFIKNARIRVLNLANRVEDKPVLAPQRRSAWLPFRFAAAGAVAAFALGTGIVYAAQSSLPGSMLYPVKVASETVALGLAPTNAMKTNVAGAVIDRRASEVKELKTYATNEEVSHAVSEYQKTVNDIRRMPGLNESHIEEHVREHEDLFDSKKDGSSNDQSGHSDEVRAGEQQNIEKENTPKGVPTPTLTIVPSGESREGSHTTNTSGVLGAHEGESKHQDEGQGGD